MNWNPNKLHYLYFHVADKQGLDYYLKVDTIAQTVWKVVVTQGPKKGRPYMRGVTQLKWSTFAGTELWNLSYQAKNNSTAFKQVKYTTKEQYVKALNSIVSEAV